jgi:hypothetical protein
VVAPVFSRIDSLVPVNISTSASGVSEIRIVSPELFEISIDQDWIDSIDPVRSEPVFAVEKITIESSALIVSVIVSIILSVDAPELVVIISVRASSDRADESGRGLGRVSTGLVMSPPILDSTGSLRATISPIIVLVCVG